jgi:Right handed beta helix region
MHGRSLAAALAVMITLALPAAASAATFTVSNTNDSGAESLEAAIAAANADSARDGIVFNIPALAGATVTIPLTSSLPDIVHPVIIDGTNQDADAQLPVAVSGGGTVDGIVVAGAGGTSSANGTQLFDLRLTAFTGAGLGVTGSYALIQDSVIDGNGGAGVSFGSGGLGAVGAGSGGTGGNRIDGNGGTGVLIGAGAGQVNVADNTIGLDAAGNASSNTGWGVSSAAGSTHVFDNTIAANGDGGVQATACGDATIVIGNLVGTDGAGPQASATTAPASRRPATAARSAAAAPARATSCPPTPGTAST